MHSVCLQDQNGYPISDVCVYTTYDLQQPSCRNMPFEVATSRHVYAIACYATWNGVSCAVLPPLPARHLAQQSLLGGQGCFPQQAA